MDIDYIIVQAGGKGSRMGYLTANKPKALVPVENLPMIFHLFQKFPEKRFIIIGDYKYDVLKQYLSVFAKVKYCLIDAKGAQGTCAGIANALKLIPEKESFALIWSDLILSKEFEFPTEMGNYLGISTDFQCRWKFENGFLEEEPSVEHGVAGFFIFYDKQQIIDVPNAGEFVRWLKQSRIQMQELPLYKTKEYGLISEYNNLKQHRCRPFNRLLEEGDKILKEGIDEQGRQLAIREKEWYKFVEPLGFRNIPRIYSYDPFIMEKINGKNIYEYDLNCEEKQEVLVKIVSMLKQLHSFSAVPTDYFSIQQAYINKTYERLAKIRDMIPFAKNEYIVINGKKCRNIFFYKEELEKKVEELDVKKFVCLHGDCTFSNMLLKDDKEPIVIDPRGYFGHTKIYGDVAYDWAKLYYSIVGNYDKFNIKKFRLIIENDEVILTIDSNHWEDMEEFFLSLIEEDVTKQQLELIHAIIWLSLTTYAWEDYDSICGAFYNGLYYLEEVL